MFDRAIFYAQKLDRLTFFRQTLFGLSWIIATSLLVFCQNLAVDVTLKTWFYLFLAFFSARTTGMCLNRLIDRFIDAQNPRTRSRPLPKGEVSVQFTTIQVSLFFLLFLYAAMQLGPICFALSCLVGLLLCTYSYLKRFTVLCHFALGAVHMLVPIAAWAAFTQSVTIEPVLLGVSLLFSIAAADIIYACQDVDFDRSHGLKSIPAAFGIKRAIDLAKFLHCVAVLFLVIFSDFCSDSKFLLLASVAVASVYYQCYRRLNTLGFEKSFTFANTYSGLTFLLFVAADFIWHAL